MRLTEFERKAKETLDKKGIKVLSRDSLLWFEREIKRSITSTTRQNVKQFGVERETFRPGQLVLYGYNPKTKDKLPYYDTMPLILVTSITEHGWFGINFHYCPPRIRTWILGQMYEISSRKTIIERDRIKLSWKLAQSVAATVGSTKWLEHSIKQYLSSHVMSKPLVIDAHYWDMMVYLPLARFKKGKPY